MQSSDRAADDRNDNRLVSTYIDMHGAIDGLKLAAAVRDRWPLVRIIVSSRAGTVEITDLRDDSVFYQRRLGGAT